MNQKYKAIIFDFFNVIHSDPLDRWLKHHGLAMNEELEEVNRAIDFGHITELEFHRRLSEFSGQSLESVEEIFESNPNFTDQLLVKLIEKLRLNYKVGLLSNASSEYLRSILQEQNLTRLFDEIVVSGEIHLIKPSAEVFHYILNKMALKPGEAIFTDDNRRNVEAAASIGIKSVIYTNREQLASDLRNLGVIF